MQVNEIKAFRQRLIRAGFTDVHIYKYKDGLYIVKCIEPNGKKTEVIYNIERIINTPRLVYFD